MFPGTSLFMGLSYLLGLFEGDGYTWTGTFGITNRDPEILQKASDLLSDFGEVRTRKDLRGSYRVCVVGRPRFRHFIKTIENQKSILPFHQNKIAEYFAGKYDADGSKWKHVIKFKITYGIEKQINYDQKLLFMLGIKSSIRAYKNCNANDLEISSHSAFLFYELIRKHSIKCLRRTTKFVS